MVVARLQKPTSLRSRRFAASLSKLLTSMRCLSSVIEAGVVRAPIFIRYDRPGSIGSALIQRTCAVNWSATSGRLSGCDKHVAARDVDFVGQRQRDGVARFRALDLPVGDEDLRHRALAAGAGDDDRLAPLDPAARNRAGEAAKVEMRAVDPLHRKTERRGAPVLLDLDALEMVEQMRPLEPGRARARRRDVVAVARRNRDGEERAEAERARRTCDSR